MDFEKFHSLLSRVLDEDDPINQLSLEEILVAIPRVDELNAVPSGTTVLIRAELDMPIKNGKVTDMSRIDSTASTIKYCHEKGWKIVLFGHIGRDPDSSLIPVCEAMRDYLGLPIEFIDDWLDQENGRLRDEIVENVHSATLDRLFMFQNARKYTVEQALWKADKASLSQISPQMYCISKDIRERLASIEINEAIAASNIDFSSSAVPLLMDKTAIGFYLSDEMKYHIQKARKANAVVFSGLKINKLDDLEGILDRGNLALIIAAGSLAMALLKARAELAGKDFFIGLAETDPSLKAYIDPERIEQAKRIVHKCDKQGVKLILPIDFVLDNGEPSSVIPEGHTQLDIGPETRAFFAQSIRAYIDANKSAPEPYVLFFNGVFGKFEDPKFEEGTKSFIPLLKETTAAGILTYVGGGEGRLALVKYGDLHDVTHAFTSGGTVLKSLTNRHIPYLKAMYLQNNERKHK